MTEDPIITLARAFVEGRITTTEYLDGVTIILEAGHEAR